MLNLSDHAVGDNALLQPVEDNIPNLHTGRRDGLHGDDLVLPDGGIHAPTRRAKPHALALGEQLFAQVCEKMYGG